MKSKATRLFSMARIKFLLVCLTILVLFNNCQSLTANREIHYLDIDSIYRTPAEMQKYFQLKKQFLKIWKDTCNCFTSDFRKDRPEDNVKKILDYRIDNILHTPNYDSVVVITALYAAWLDEKGNNEGDLTVTSLMKAIIDSNGKWHFKCDWNNFSMYSDGNTVSSILKDYRKMIISYGYLKNGRPDPEYIHNLFTKALELNH